jgi:hypothetical protein
MAADSTKPAYLAIQTWLAASASKPLLPAGLEELTRGIGDAALQAQQTIAPTECRIKAGPHRFCIVLDAPCYVVRSRSGSVSLQPTSPCGKYDPWLPVHDL